MYCTRSPVFISLLLCYCAGDFFFSVLNRFVHRLSCCVDGLRIVSNPVDDKVRHHSAHAYIENGFHFPSLKVVADAGFEPASPNGREILSLLCIPFHQSAIIIIYHTTRAMSSDCGTWSVKIMSRHRYLVFKKKTKLTVHAVYLVYRLKIVPPLVARDLDDNPIKRQISIFVFIEIRIKIYQIIIAPHKVAYAVKGGRNVHTLNRHSVALDLGRSSFQEAFLYNKGGTFPYG